MVDNKYNTHKYHLQSDLMSLSWKQVGRRSEENLINEITLEFNCYLQKVICSALQQGYQATCTVFALP